MTTTTVFNFEDLTNYTYDTTAFELSEEGYILSLRSGSDDNFFYCEFLNTEDFVYDEKTAEVCISNFPGATFAADYKNTIHGSFGDGALTGVATGGAVITNNKLDLAAGTVRYVTYTSVNNMDLASRGCIKLKFTPNYAGIPASSTQQIFNSGINGSANNEIRIYHTLTTGRIGYRINSSAGTTISQGEVTWSPSAGVEYVIELDFDIVNDFAVLYIDGVAVTDSTGTGTRTDSSIIRLGALMTVGVETSNFYLNDLIIYSLPQHYKDESFIATYSIEDLTGNVDLKTKGATFAATFTTSINGDWGEGTLTGAASGGASVLNGKLDLAHNDARRVKWAVPDNYQLNDCGCLRFRVTPNYSGSPSVDNWFFRSDDFEIVHYFNGNFGVAFLDDEDNWSDTDAAWSPTAGTTYIIEINFDSKAGFSSVFIDGVLHAESNGSPFVRAVPSGYFYIGDILTASNFYIDDLVLFNKMQKIGTSSFSPIYSIESGKTPYNKYYNDAAFAVTFNDDINANWGEGILTGTASGGASILNGYLSLVSSDARYVTYNAIKNAPLTDKGCVRFIYKPNYSNAPAATQTIITWGEPNSASNVVSLTHATGTALLGFFISDLSGANIVTSSLTWNPVSGTDYVIELNFDTLNGYANICIDGTVEDTAFGMGFRQAPSILRIGNSVNTGGNTSNFSLRDLLVFFCPQHVADSYDPEYKVPPKNSFTGISQVPTVNSDCQLFATYETSINLNMSRGSGTGVASGGATITGNRLDLTGGGSKSVSYSAAFFSNLSMIGCIKLKIRPNYSGSPAADYYLYTFADSNVSDINLLSLRHNTSNGNLRLIVYDDAGASAIGVDLGAWTPVSGTTYEIELNYDFTERLGNNEGETKLFVDGSQLGSTIATTVSRSDSIGLLCVGADRAGTSNNNCYVEDFIVFDRPQHFVNYTKGYSLEYDKYAETIIELPSFVYVGVKEITSLDDLLVNEISGSPRYIVNDEYWTGAAWAASSDTYATASELADIQNNIADITPFDTVVVKVIFPSSSEEISRISAVSLEYSDELYSMDNPYIIANTGVQSNGLVSFASINSVVGSDAVKFVLTVDDVDKYWTGAAWATSTGYAQSNTAAEINTNCASLVLTGGKVVKPKVYLHSDDGSTTPSITSMTTVYAFEGFISETPRTCVVYGFFKDPSGTAQADVVVTAKATSLSYYESVYVTQKIAKTTSDADGYWGLTLVENETMTGSHGYIFTMSGTGISSTSTKVVPDERCQNYAELANL